MQSNFLPFPFVVFHEGRPHLLHDRVVRALSSQNQIHIPIAVQTSSVFSPATATTTTTATGTATGTGTAEQLWRGFYELVQEQVRHSSQSQSQSVPFLVPSAFPFTCTHNMRIG
jgi:hypothetical protein